MNILLCNALRPILKLLAEAEAEFGTDAPDDRPVPIQSWGALTLGELRQVKCAHNQVCRELTQKDES